MSDCIKKFQLRLDSIEGGKDAERRARRDADVREVQVWRTEAGRGGVAVRVRAEEREI
jgi:hypothetical protein